MPLSRIPFKTWIELDASAFKANVNTIRGILGTRTRLWFVVKSNAYGHSLVHMSTLAQENGVDGFCVDSVIEGGRLREAGIVKPILALGPTLPHLFAPAAERKIILTIAGREYLDALGRSKARPDFHLKIDSGMHRQGFAPEEIPAVAGRIRRHGLAPRLKGAYTHFAAAKDPTYQAYTRLQFEKFSAASAALEKSGLLGKGRAPALRGQRGGLSRPPLSSRPRPGGHRPLRPLAVQGARAQAGRDVHFQAGPVLAEHRFGNQNGRKGRLRRLRHERAAGPEIPAGRRAHRLLARLRPRAVRKRRGPRQRAAGPRPRPGLDGHGHHRRHRNPLPRRRHGHPDRPRRRGRRSRPASWPPASTRPPTRS